MSELSTYGMAEEFYSELECFITENKEDIPNESESSRIDCEHHHLIYQYCSHEDGVHDTNEYYCHLGELEKYCLIMKNYQVSLIIQLIRH